MMECVFPVFFGDRIYRVVDSGQLFYLCRIVKEGILYAGLRDQPGKDHARLTIKISWMKKLGEPFPKRPEEVGRIGGGAA